MSTTPTTIDPRAKRWGNVAKILFLIFAFALLAPVIWLAVGGILGFIFFLAIYIGAWMIRPWVFAKAANTRLKMIKHEAAKNPVETLQNELQRQSLALEQRRVAIGNLNGQIRSLSDKVDSIGQKYGKTDSAYVKLAEQLHDLQRVANNRETKWKGAAQQLKRFEQEIERAGYIWDAAQAAAQAQESSGLTEDDLTAKLRTETSLDAIRDSFNTQLAALDTDLLSSDTEAERAAVVVEKAKA